LSSSEYIIILSFVLLLGRAKIYQFWKAKIANIHLRGNWQGSKPSIVASNMDFKTNNPDHHIVTKNVIC